VAARGVIAGLVAVMLAVVVVRNAAVDALYEARPDAAARVWPRHPAIEASRTMIGIARAAAARRAVDPNVFLDMVDAARKAPLMPEPFLVRGVQAQVAGKPDVAEQAFRAAEQRDPRSLPAHYFLAEQYFRSGNASRGLAEVAMLVNLAPNGVGSAAPFVASYARDRTHWPSLRSIFRRNPAVEDATLIALAADPANTEIVRALASPDRTTAASPWLPVLLGSLTTAGQYGRAKAVWSWAARVGSDASALLFDADFSRPKLPPPFNWALTSSTVGLAERQPGSRLHVMFYGQEDGVLARQLLVLPAGAYRMSLRLVGDPAQVRAISWSLKCANAQEAAAAVRLDVAAARGWAFNVPANCPAQWLELSGRSSDLSQESDFAITGLRLEPARA
jgi:hypothetical protein